MKKIICLYGGPGIGKSTTMAGIFFKLKCAGMSGEMNPEYVKNWVWEERPIKPGDQTYFFSKQSRRERSAMENNLDFIVTDSPLILTNFYGLKYDIFEKLSNTSYNMLLNHHEVCKYYGYKVDHYLLTRKKIYDKKGRYQTEDEAIKFDEEIEKMLEDKNIKFEKVESNNSEEAVEYIVKKYLNK